MHRPLLPAVVLALTGCQGCQQPPPAPVMIPTRTLTDDEKRVVGLTVRDAIAKLGAKEAECIIGDEPPGIARYVSVKVSDGRTIQLWLDRHPGMMRENFDWSFELVADKPVVRVE